MGRSAGTNWDGGAPRPGPEGGVGRGEPRAHRIGEYEATTLLAQDALARVYLARKPGIERNFALKLLEADVAPDLVARTRRGAELASRLEHPGVIAPVDIGQHKGRLFLVSEHVPGPTLADRLRQGPLPWRDAAPLVAKVADAVEAAHRAGIAHRDLKPSNVILDAREGVPRVTDFGLGLQLPSGLTRDRELLGPPAYLAPEQVRGDVADARSDIYALGLMLYECIAGAVPFRGRTLDELARRILEGEAPSLVPTAPPEVDAICRGAMALDPAARFPTAAAFAERLRQVLDTFPKSSDPSTASSGLMAPRPSRFPVTALLVPVFALVALLFGVWGSQERATRQALTARVEQVEGLKATLTAEADAARAELAILGERLALSEGTLAEVRARAATAAERAEAERARLNERLTERLRAMEASGEGVRAWPPGAVGALVDHLIASLANAGTAAQVVRARLLHDRGRYAEAVVIIQEVGEAGLAFDPWLSVLEARALYKGGELRAASQRFLRIAQAEPESPRGLFARALMDGQRLGGEETVDLLRRAAAAAPESEPVRIMLSRHLEARAVQTRDVALLREAEAEADAAVKVRPTSAQAYFQRSSTRYHQWLLGGGQDRDAARPVIADLEHARELLPDPEYWLWVGKSYLEMLDQPRLAARELEEGLRRAQAGNHAALAMMIATWLGAARYRLDDPDGALELWQAALRGGAGTAVTAVILHTLREGAPATRERFLARLPAEQRTAIERALATER